MIDALAIAELPVIDERDHYDPPANKKLWNWLRRSATRAELLQCGLVPMRRTATGEVWLFPAHWYHKLPTGLRIHTAEGIEQRFAPDKHTDAATLGMLAFGIHRWLGPRNIEREKAALNATR